MATVRDAIAELRSGRMIAICDRHGCDLVIAAEFAGPDALNFMATHGRGPISLVLTAERCEALNLRPIAPHGNGRLSSAAMVPIEAREGVSTGISTADRARTIAVAVDPSSSAGHIAQPGHVFPLGASPGGVLARPAKAEASVDLARLAGVQPAAVKCGVLGEDGEEIGSAEAIEYCLRHGVQLVAIDAVVAFRLRHDRIAERFASTVVDTAIGPLRALLYRTDVDDRCRAALVKGDLDGHDRVALCVPPVGDGAGLELALAAVGREGRGVVACVLDGRRAEELAASATACPASALRAALAPRRPLGQLDWAVTAQLGSSLGIRYARVYIGVDELTTVGPMLSYLLTLGVEVSVRALAEPVAGARGVTHV